MDQRAQRIQKKKSDSKLTVFEVPGNIDFDVTAKAGRVLYDNYDITNAKGALKVRNKTIYFKDMGMNMLDGASKDEQVRTQQQILKSQKLTLISV